MSEAKEEKRCSRCKKTKPRTNAYFSKNKRTLDGFCPWCKKCQKEYRDERMLYTNPNTPKTYELHSLECTCKECEKRNERIYKNQRGRGKAAVTETLGIQDWNQVDSVLREMAELQSDINKEMTVCEKRASMIKKYSDEVIEPWLVHQIALQTMLQNFLRKNSKKRIVGRYRFGVINFFRGRLKIKLNLKLAKRQRGKP